MDIEVIRKNIIDEVARIVVARLPEDHKQQIIGEALKAVVSDYDFKRHIEAKLKVEAERRLDVLLTDAEFDKQLCAGFQKGIDLFMEALPKVVAAAMVGTLVGPNQYQTGAIYHGLVELLRLAK